MADFISVPFYDLLQENGHVPEIRRKLPPLLAGIRRSVLEIGAGTGLITTSLAGWTHRLRSSRLSLRPVCAQCCCPGWPRARSCWKG
jgi:hypothetical protein